MYKSKFSPLLLVACLGLQVNRLQVAGSYQLSNLPVAFSSGVQPGLRPTALTTLENLQPSNLQPSTLLVQSSNCPADVETLTARLLKDLPSYANRVIQRSRRLNRIGDSFSYVVVAGRPEFEPLNLGPGEYTPANPATEVEPPKQVFFTTLERRYQSGKAINTQLYHWLFLTQTTGGWRLVLIFSRIGSSVPGRPPTPPRESSNGIIGQAVSTWLRDCRAGVIRPPRRISPTNPQDTPVIPPASEG